MADPARGRIRSEPLDSTSMRIAHVRERHAAAGTPWRLAAARDADATRWLDLEEARQGLVVEDPRRAHNSPLFRQPVTTLDEHLARGLRVEALAEIVEGYAAAAEDDEAVLPAGDLVFGPPILRPPAIRDFYAFERHVKTMWERRGGTVPEAWYRLPIFYFSNTSEIRGPGEPVWAPRGSTELDTAPNQPRATASSRVSTSARSPRSPLQRAATSSTAPPAQ